MSQKSLYLHDREWESSFAGKVVTILKTLMPHLVDIAVASDEMDIKQATDFELQLSGGTIAVRLRRPDCTFRDLTIRAKRDSGAKTELEKIKAGHAFRYFYGWIDDKGAIAEWILVDLNKVREAGLLEKKRPFIPNKDKNGKPDGTHFIAINPKELNDTGCLIKVQSKRSRQVNTQPSLIVGIQLAKQVKCYKPRVTEDYHLDSLWEVSQ